MIVKLATYALAVIGLGIMGYILYDVFYASRKRDAQYAREALQDTD